jgi:RNA polymerase sigma-70 factor (ECF subfamily)
METSDRIWRERGLRAAVLAGDERAWRTWYDESFEDLYAYVAWRCGGLRDLADEVVQDTWLIAVRSIGRFDPEQGSFGAWLRGIAANVLRNSFRRRRSNPMQPLNGRHVSAQATSAADRECSERIAVALVQLPERYEAVLRAKYFERRSVAQIASQWKETPKAIESLLTRARLAFRQAYQQEE